LSDRIVTALDDYEHMQAKEVSPRVSFSMAELRSANLAERLRLDPLRHVRALEEACRSVAIEEGPRYAKSGNIFVFEENCWRYWAINTNHFAFNSLNSLKTQSLASWTCGRYPS
jgi:hypothetical protein